MNKQKLKKKLAVVALILVGVSICHRLFGMQAMCVYKIHKQFSPSETPNMYVIPAALPDLESSEIASSITNRACVFATPWSDPSLFRDATNLVVYSFPNDVKIILEPRGITAFGADHFRKSISNDEDNENLEDLFETTSLQSNYDFLNACFSSTPKQVSIFSNKNVALQKTIFLIFKSVLIPVSDMHAFYMYDSKEMKGFQFGDPAKDTNIHLICFTSPDSSLEIRVRSKSHVSQEDINCIIKSVKYSANQGRDTR